MKCIIIDDEEFSRVILSELTTNHQDVTLVNTFPNAMEGMKFLNNNAIDFIFLDIHMPSFTGFDLIQTLANPPKIILTTSDSSKALDSYEYSCVVDYLVKPITLERFNKSIAKIKNVHSVPTTKPLFLRDKEEESLEDILYVNIDRRLVKIDIPAINIIEAKGDYILIKTDKKNYTVHSTLKKIEDKLKHSFFLKVHRSFIINIFKIIDIEDNSILIDKDVIPISRSNRAELMQQLNLL